VKALTHPFIPACRAALVAGSVLALAGCLGDHSPGESADGDEDHVGHVIPAHKPKAFPQAVGRLRELNDQFIRDGIPRQAGSSREPNALQIALDIAHWLPETAADSEMPEAPWDEVNALSDAIVADYKAILSGDAGDLRRELDSAGAEIGKLEAILRSSDPRWFAGPNKAGAASSSTWIDVKNP
jgi:hypothetical protein